MLGFDYHFHVEAPSTRSLRRWGYDLELAGQQSSLEAKLSCPAGAMTVLQQAFALQLNRYEGWDCPEHEAFRWAAKYYKRGISFPAFTGSCKVRFIEYFPDFADFDFVVVDSNVHQSCEQAQLVLETSETQKTLQLVANIMTRWRELSFPKRWLIIGGGILLDVGAFAAALSKAKITLMPTTLIAMLDASVGGKTGVNFPPFGKNQVGSYYFPEQVLITPTWLQQLPERQLLAGSWEVIKHAIISADFDMLNTWLAWQSNINPENLLVSDLHAALAVKVKIITADAGEQGLRRVLNFGHTLGHALEAIAHVNNAVILHGEAVAYGIAFALLVSEALGERCDYAARIFNALPLRGKCLNAALGTPDLLSPALWQQIMYFVRHDKKSNADRRWILLADGKPSSIPRQVDEEILVRCWQKLCLLNR